MEELRLQPDMTVLCGDGLISLRVGAIILKDGKFLLAGNDFNDYLYSVGGRIRFGETAEQAVVREVLEETGVHMEIDRLGFVHENYFMGDVPGTFGKPIYEVCFLYERSGRLRTCLQQCFRVRKQRIFEMGLI